MSILSRRNGADLVGIGSAVLCIAHCLLLPLLLVVGSFSDHWHSVDYLFILLAGVAVFFSARRLNQTFLRTSLWISWLTFSGAILLHDRYAGALYVSLLASVALALLHLASYRAKHR